MKSISRWQRLTPTFLGVIASRGDVIRQLQIVSHANRREQPQQQQQHAYIYSCTILIIIITIQIIIKIIIIRNQLRKYAKLETCRFQRRQWVLGNNLKSTLRMRNAVYTLEHRSHFVWIYILIATNESIEYIPHDICQSEWRFVCAFDVDMDVVTLRPPDAVPPIPST